MISVPRFLGPRIALRRANRKHPRAKHPIEVRDRAQPYAREFWFDAPRPTKMVFPSTTMSYV